MRSEESDRVFEATLPDAPIEVLILLAAGAVLLAAAQGLIEQLVAGGPPDFSAIVEWRVAPVLVWIAAAPLLLGAARAVGRATGGSWPRLLAAHSVLAAAWIALSNLLMHVPAALRGEPINRLLVEAARHAVEYGPAAVAAYAGLAIIGHSRAHGRSSQRKGSGTSPGAPPSDASDAADARRSAPDHLAIRCGVRIHMVDRTEVRWVEADGDHVRIHTVEKSYRTRGTLGAYERELAADGFLRVHRSALVHPRAIREIQPFYRGDHVAVLRDGSEVRIPRTREDVLEALLAPTVEA